MIRELTSRQNPYAKHIASLGSDRSYRRKTGQYLCDGIKLLHDALYSRAEIVSVMVSEGFTLPELPENIDIVRVPERLLNALSPLETPQGVLFTVKFPACMPVPPSSGQYLWLDRLQDPGNVGAILRSAEAFGLRGVYLSPHSADPFGPKAVRAGMGAVFRMSVGFAKPEELLGGDLPIYATAAGDGVSLAETGLSNCIVALGNEGNGLDKQIIAKSDGLIHIPMSGGAESLGVSAAAAIICYEMSNSR